jgi:branched-chain amino acid transport system ATP-binding protein
MELLETRRLTRQFGALVAVNGVSLTFREGELTSIIGPNGAGKTTFYNLLTGKVYPSGGTILYRGEEISRLPPFKRVRLGLSRTFQITNIFKTMTVLENVRVARIIHAGKAGDLFRPAEKNAALTDESLVILERVGLAEKRDVVCAELPYGDCRLVEIALALATEPSLLFLDEPTAGMNPKETLQIVAIIRRLFEEKRVNFVVTEHDMEVVFSISDRIVVMNQGTVLADGVPEEIRRNEKVVEAYLGKGSQR